MFEERRDFDLKPADDHEVRVSVGQEEVTATRSRLQSRLSFAAFFFNGSCLPARRRFATL